VFASTGHSGPGPSFSQTRCCNPNAVLMINSRPHTRTCWTGVASQCSTACLMHNDYTDGTFVTLNTRFETNNCTKVYSLCGLAVSKLASFVSSAASRAVSLRALLSSPVFVRVVRLIPTPKVRHALVDKESIIVAWRAAACGSKLISSTTAAQSL